MVMPFVVAVLFMSQLPYSCARKLQEQPPALEFLPRLHEDLLCPPPPPPPMASLSSEFPFTLQPPPGPDDLACPPPPPPPQTQCPPTPPKPTSLYYFPPSPMTFLPPEFSFPLQPPPAPEFSSPAPSSSIVRWLSGLGSVAVVTLLLLGCRMVLILRAAPAQPSDVEMVAMRG